METVSRASVSAVWGLTFILTEVFVIALYEIICDPRFPPCDGRTALAFYLMVGVTYAATLWAGWRVECPDEPDQHGHPRIQATGAPGGACVAAPAFS